MRESFSLELSRVDGTAQVVPSGEIDLATAALLRGCIAGLEGRVTVDLSRVTFLDSTGIGVLIGQRNRLRHADGELILLAPREFVRRTLEAVGLTDWIQD